MTTKKTTTPRKPRAKKTTDTTKSTTPTNPSKVRVAVSVDRHPTMKGGYWCAVKYIIDEENNVIDRVISDGMFLQDAIAASQKALGHFVMVTRAGVQK